MQVLKILKTNLLNLDYLTNLEFDVLRKKIIDEKYIKSVNTFLSRLFKFYNNSYGINKDTTKLYLSSYMIMSHRELITNNDTYAIKLENNAVDMLMFLETLFTKEKITLKDYNNFMNSFNRYIKFFKVWKERDSLIIARPAINSYFNIDMIVVSLNKKLEDNMKKKKEK